VDSDYVALKTGATDKETYTIYHRPDGEAAYSDLVCRVYKREWAERIVALLNSAVDWDE